MYFMRYKSEMFAKFNVQKTKVKNQRWRKIKCLMSDNGIKCTNLKFIELCEHHRIKRHFTVSKIPWHNVLVKRMSRTIVEKVRCLRLNVRLAKNIWVEVVNMLCFFFNRSPRKKLDGKVAKEVWTGSPVTILVWKCWMSNLCLCF